MAVELTEESDIDANLEGKVSVITGGSEGIGYGIAEMLLSKGSAVYLVARSQEKLDRAKAKLENGGGKVGVYSGDITNFFDIKKIIDDIYEKEKRIDIFVNNAGEYKPYSIDGKFEDIKQLWNLLFVAPSEITHYLVQRASLDKENNLKILNIMSQASVRVLDNGMGYGVGKAAFDSFLNHCELELSKHSIHNIKIYRIYPASVATEKTLELVKRGILQNPVSLDEVIKKATDLIEDKIKGNRAYVGFTPAK